MRWLNRPWILLLASGLAFLLGGSAAGATPAGPPTLTSVSSLQCPLPTLCVGIDSGAAADLVTSHAPRLAAGAWIPQTIGRGGRLRVLSCASTQWCVAVDQRNDVLISTDPGRGAASWKIAPGGPAGHLDNVGSLSCPTSGLCVGVAGHYVVSSTHPDQGGTAWGQALVNPNAPADAINCPTVNLCVAVSDNDRVMTSTDPTAPNDWTSLRLESGSGNRASVSCASITQCVVSDASGNMFSTSNLEATHPTWQRDRLGPSRYRPQASVGVLVSCTTADVCAAAGDDGSVWASPPPSPASTRRRWPRVALNGPITAPFTSLTSIACVRGQLCVATDNDGHALSANAITQPGAWRRQTIGQPRPATSPAVRP